MCYLSIFHRCGLLKKNNIQYIPLRYLFFIFSVSYHNTAFLKSSFSSLFHGITTLFHTCVCALLFYHISLIIHTYFSSFHFLLPSGIAFAYQIRHILLSTRFIIQYVTRSGKRYNSVYTKKLDGFVKYSL